jgi:hypothetical protein
LPLLLALLLYSPILLAQDQDSDAGPSWRLSYFPYLSGGYNDGPLISLRARYWQPAEYEARNTYTAAVDAATGLTLRGGRHIGARFHAPL